MSTRINWYQQSVAKVLRALATDKAGLTSTEARLRLTKYGHNELEFKRRGPLIRLLLQFHSPLIYVLLASAAVTAFLDMWIDTGVILTVVLANTAIGFIQEGKAEASMEGLRKMMVPQCRVLRDGEKRDIPARELVPGDIVVLDEGDRVPADLRLLYAKNLSADEAALTGESVPVEKDIEPISKPDPLPADQSCMAFSGTFITRGSGQGVVIATGEKTEIGKIAKKNHIFFHTDATQAIGKFSLRPKEWNVDAVSFSGHKFHGPKGIGGLYLKDDCNQIMSLCYGGEQERQIRPGTENVACITGMSKALVKAHENRQSKNDKLYKKTSWIEKKLREKLNIRILGPHKKYRLPHTMLILFEDMGSCNKIFVKQLDKRKICVSVGSACQTKSEKGSHVLDTLDIKPSDKIKIIRISLSDYTTDEECAYLVENLIELIGGMRR